VLWHLPQLLAALRPLSLAGAFAALALAAGCRSAADRWEDVLGGISDRRAAAMSWQESRSIYAGMPNGATFAEGYKAGYRYVSAGGDASQPPAPPRRFSLRRYQTRDGMPLGQSWVDGFAHGALAAQLDDQEGATDRQYRTFDTTLVRQGQPDPTAPWQYGYGMTPPSMGPEGTEMILSPEAAPSSAHGMPQAVEAAPAQLPAEPLRKVEGTPSFVPPPPAPPVEDASAAKAPTTQPASHTAGDEPAPSSAARSTPPLTIDANQKPAPAAPATAKKGEPLPAPKKAAPRKPEFELPLVGEAPEAE